MKRMNHRFRAQIFVLLVVGFLTRPAMALTPSIDIKNEGFRSESQFSIVAANGNSQSQTFNFVQKNGYRRESDTFKSEYAFLRSQAGDKESARNWGAAIRYERLLGSPLSLYLGQGLESDPYAGIDLRFNSDVGLRYPLINADLWSWFGETGLRYTSEKRVKPPDVFEQLARLYMEVNWKIGDAASARYWIEYLPNISRPDGYLVNTEASISAILTSILSLKFAYLLKHNNSPPPGTTGHYDTLVSTALVAAF